MNGMRMVAVLGATAALCGCNGALSRGPEFDTTLLLPVLHDTVPDKNPDFSATTDGSTTNNVIIPLSCKAAASSTQQPDRNTCVWDLVRIIDEKYDRYKNSLTALTRGATALTDVAVVGLGAAGTATGGAGAKTIFSAISGALTGAKGVLDTDYLYGKSIDIVANQMDADRNAQMTVIVKQLTATLANYSLSQAKDDVLKYYVAGTFGHALQSLASQTASTASACKAQADQTKAKAAAGKLAPDSAPETNGKSTDCPTTQPAPA